MQWTFGGLLTYIENLIGADSGFSTKAETLLKVLINTSINRICTTFPIKELREPDYSIRTVADYSTGTVSVAADAKAVTGAATVWTYDMKGRKIRFEGETVYHIIADVTSGTALTLDRPYRGTAKVAVTYEIFENNYNLPLNCNWIKSISTFDGANWQSLGAKDWDYVDQEDVGLNCTGTPEIYAEVGPLNIREPITGVNTADTSTSTTSVVDAALKATEEDYYVDWTLVNVTLGKMSKITAYNVASTTLTIEEAITAQVATDTYYLIAPFNQVTFYPRETAISYLLLKYYRKHPELINAYDIPLLPNEFQHLIAAEVLVDWYGTDPLASKWQVIKGQAESVLQKKYARKIDRTQKEGRRNIRGRELSYRVENYDA